MLVVGLTGGIGSGKSAASKIFSELGRPVIDADLVAREVVEPGEPALVKIATKFGAGVLTPQGELDRASLREKVFSDNQAREWLEQLLHPVIRTRIMEKIEDYQGTTPLVILASPLLLETDQHKLVDHVVVIDVPESLQISRTVARDNNSEALVKRIMDAQLSRDERLSKADSVLDNGGSVESLKDQIRLLDLKLRELAADEYRL